MNWQAFRPVFVIYLLCCINRGRGELLPFSHGRQSRGEGYTGPSVHFAREAIDGDPDTYSCTESSRNSWIQLYFATPVLPHWIKFSLKPTSTLSLLDHKVDLFNGERWVRSCDLEYEERWVCTNPVSLATSVRVSIRQGKMEIAHLEAHGDRLPIEELKYKPVCNPRSLEPCWINPIEWDLECKPIDILSSDSSYQQHLLTLMSDEREKLGTLTWSKFGYVALVSEQCDVVYGKTSNFNNDQAGGRWCVIKNNTHFELKDGMHSQLQTDLEDNSCRSPLLGNSVGFVNFTENLGNAKYRAGVHDMSEEPRFRNNDWMELSEGDVGPLMLEKTGIAVYVGEDVFGSSFSIPFYTSTGVGMNKRMDYLGSLKLTTNTFAMEGCEGEHVFPEEEDIVGTWMFEKNETYMLICKDGRAVEGIQFDEHGFECARLYSGNVVYGIGTDRPNIKYRELTKSGPDEMRFVRSCPDCVPDYFLLEKHGISWTVAPEVTEPLSSLTLTMMDRDRLVIGTVEITSSTIVVTADGCNFVKEGDFNLQGEWRLVKLVDMICIFLEGVMVFEQHLEGPECMAGNVVQYLSFNQEGILYQRTKKDIEKIYAEVYELEETANCPEGYGPLVFNTADGYKEVDCQPCRRGTYSTGRECLYCPKGMFTLDTASTGLQHCIPKEMIECDGIEAITKCWLKSEEVDNDDVNDTTDFCNCRSDQYCDRDGDCYEYQMSDSRRTAALPWKVFSLTVLNFMLSKLLRM
ncbi:hypothetical protein ACHWQZ_G008416 [Mnemiopsis leidyi]